MSRNKQLLVVVASVVLLMTSLYGYACYRDWKDKNEFYNLSPQNQQTVSIFRKQCLSVRADSFIQDVSGPGKVTEKSHLAFPWSPAPLYFEVVGVDGNKREIYFSGSPNNDLVQSSQIKFIKADDPEFCDLSRQFASKQIVK